MNEGRRDADGITSVDLHMWEGEVWDKVRLAMQDRPCHRCDGVGLTLWDAFWDGIANIVRYLVGRPVRTYCKRCDGTGREPGGSR